MNSSARSCERALLVTVALGVVFLVPGCAEFNQGVEDALDQDKSDDYGWAHELYEMPLGLVCFPLFLALSPILFWIPDDDGDFGYVLGRAFGRDFIYLDPTDNLELP